MIRPVLMSNSVYFGRKDVNPKTETKSDKMPPNNVKVKEDVAEPPKKNNSVKNTFIAGALLGAVLGGAGAVGYEHYQTKELLRDMNIEAADGAVDSLEVKDINDDDVPEIILKCKDGSSAVYDMNNHKSYIQFEDEIIEKI